MRADFFGKQRCFAFCSIEPNDTIHTERKYHGRVYAGYSHPRAHLEFEDCGRAREKPQDQLQKKLAVL